MKVGGEGEEGGRGPSTGMNELRNEYMSSSSIEVLERICLDLPYICYDEVLDPCTDGLPRSYISTAFFCIIKAIKIT